MSLFLPAALILAFILVYALAAFGAAPVLLWVALVAFLLLLLPGWFFGQSSEGRMRSSGSGIVMIMLLFAVLVGVFYRPYPLPLPWYLVFCIAAAVGWIIGLGMP